LSQLWLLAQPPTVHAAARESRRAGVPTAGRRAPRQVVAAEPSETLRVKPVYVARGDRTYVLTGGLGGFGLALAVWLSQRGARHFVLSSKRCARLPAMQP